MAATRFPLTLDDTLPFVKTVKGVVADPSSIDAAVEALCSIESTYGVEILRDFCPDSVLPAGVFRPKSFPPRYSDILESFRDWDQFQNVYDGPVDDDIDAQLFSLLSDTQLIVQGMDFTNDYFIRCAEGAIYSWTQRGWGQLLASWANATGWGPHGNARGDCYTWKYTDFYCNMSDEVVSEYELWRDTLFEVIDDKCRIQLES